MAKKTVNVLVSLTFESEDKEVLSNNNIDDALHNLDYEFIYEDEDLKIVDTEILDTFVPTNY